MLTENEATLIKDLASAVGKSAEFITEQYSSWLLVNAIGWFMFGIFALWAVTKMKFDEHSEIATWGQWLIKGVVTLIAACFIFSSLPDIINPKAAAIHQLINEVRSK